MTTDPVESDVCHICLDDNPTPVQSGCACRGPNGLVHVECLIKKAEIQRWTVGMSAWWRCQTCTLEFMGPVKTALARALHCKMRDEGVESESLMLATYHLSNALFDDGEFVDAERFGREAYDTASRRFGVSHPKTLICAENLALKLGRVGRQRDAEDILREVLRERTELYGEENPDTLESQHHLASCMGAQGDLRQAEQNFLQVHALRSRVLGPEHYLTLLTAQCLATVVRRQRRPGEAERLQREVLRVQTRVLGPHHISRLNTANSLALSIADQGRLDEARRLLSDNLRVSIEARGPGSNLAYACKRMLQYVNSLRDNRGQVTAWRELRRHVTTCIRQPQGSDTPRENARGVSTEPGGKEKEYPSESVVCTECTQCPRNVKVSGVEDVAVCSAAGAGGQLSQLCEDATTRAV